jgi:hypothetical protein
MKKNGRTMMPTRHDVSLTDPRGDGLRAEGWSYKSKGSREVFVQIVNANGHLVTARLLILHAR